MVRMLQPNWPTLLVFFSTITVSVSRIIEDVADLNVDHQYDFVVIGGGTAGNVIANRLTENPDFSVLVLEAGGSNENILNAIVPFYCPRMAPATAYDWNFTTTPQAGLDGRSIAYPRGYILGGSSSVNCLAYTRGTIDDYNRYAEMSGDSGWSWDEIKPYILKNERFSPPADNHNITAQFNPAVHGYNGMIGVSLPGFPQGIDERVLQATRELPSEFPYNIDTNSGYQIGIGWQQATIAGGVRSSSATGYLAPQFISRPNLDVLIHAQVTRLLQTTSTLQSEVQHLPLRTVEFAKSGGGPRHTVTATKEVILSAGSIGTPHILMVSGIGDSNELAAFGIKSILHLPSVGKNLSDHSAMINYWSVNSTDTYDTASRNATLAAEQFDLWNTTRTGPLVDTSFNQIGWLRLPENATIFNDFPDPSSGPHSAHFEFVFTNGMGGASPPTGNFMGLHTAVLSPLSRGSVTLRSGDPFDAPLVDPNLLSSPFDMFVLRESIRSARQFLTAPVWANYIIRPLSNSTTDDELEQEIRANGGSFFHPVGTAAMSPKGESHGVVDPDLRVKGVQGLRIVDASVIPVVPAAHTQVVVYAFAERAADLVKGAWE